jgi:hypothetical protein
MVALPTTSGSGRQAGGGWRESFRRPDGRAQGCDLFSIRHRPIWAAAAALCVLAAAAWPAGSSASAAHHPTRAERQRAAKARERRRLSREIRANPKALLKPSFIRKAQLSDYELPLTIRLNAATDATGTAFAPSDDVLQLSPDTSTQAWPQPGDLAPGVSWAPLAPVTTTLSGGFTMQMSFNTDTSGYGAFGTVETRQGQASSLHGSAFGISDFNTACSTGPALRVKSGTSVAFTSAGTTYGFVNIINETAAGVLHLYADLTSERAESCDPVANSYASTPEDASQATPIVVTYNGRFHLSPAITRDGRLRLGRITVDDTSTAQMASFGYVHSCTAASTSTCNEAAFPYRVKLLNLTAEVLIGAAPS